MPDTKSGRERKGRNKRRQLEDELASREVSLDEEEEPPASDEGDSEFLADPSEVADEGDLAADDD
jgi:hypothetical protein